MKRLYVILDVTALWGTISCSSVKNYVDDAGGISGIASSIPASTLTGGVDFKKGEVLCAWYENTSLMENSYYAGKILTPATPATKNQAEVLFLNGKQKWVKIVLPSHKADKSELRLNRVVLYHGSGHREEISQDSYRKGTWRIGRVTSTDELFKGVVEIKGRKYQVKWTRITNKPIR